MPDFDLKSLSDVADVRMGQSPPSSSCSEEPCGLPFLQGCAEFGPRHPTPQFYCNPPLRTARSKSILISVRAPVGDMNIADQDYCIGRGLGAVAGTQADTAFLFYSMEHHRRQLQRVAQGSTFEAIGSRELRGMRLPIPSRPVQERIATILTTVDNQIEKTEALIAKYQSIKQGLMHDLFTRGVDEHGRLRPSRDEAPQLYKESELGWIPKDWIVTKIRDQIKMLTSGSRGWATYYSETGPLFLRIGNLTREHINFRWDDVQRVQPPTSSEGQRTVVQEGDVLISVTADLGIIAVVPPRFEEGYVNQHIALVRFDQEKANPRFVGHFLQTVGGFEQFQRLNDSGAKAGLNLPAVASIRFPQVDPSEASHIAKKLDAIDARIRGERIRLTKAKSLKFGLMQDLLTGKVPVKPEPDDQDNGITPNGAAKAGVKSRGEGIHA